MERVDLLALNKTSRSYSVRNAFTGRQTMLPSCSKRWTIKKGPTFPRICAAPADVLPSEIARRHGFKHDDPRISERVPVEFSLVDSETPSKHSRNFPVEVIVWSMENYPDLSALSWSLFDCCLSEHAADELSGCVMLKGSFRSIANTEHTPESLQNSDYRECIIAYDTMRSRGWLGEVAKPQELPACGVIKNLDVLAQVVSGFTGGFLETFAPDSATCWGRLCGGNHGRWVCCDATREKEAEWRYASRGDDGTRLLNLFAVRHMNRGNMHWDELVGDAFLCSDGTVLHSYHFSRKEWGGNPPIPTDWKDGYYYNRIYPPGSLMVPESITDSFQREMPAWFYEAEEDRRTQAQQVSR